MTHRHEASDRLATRHASLRIRLALRFAGACVLVSLLAAVATPVSATGETRNVLLLYSAARLLPASIEADRGLRQVLEQSADQRVDVYAEYLDVPRFQGDAYVQSVATFLREKYARTRPDVIVAGGDDALAFLLDNRALFFPNTPVVHLGVTKPFLRSRPPLPADVIGIPVEFDAINTIKLAFELRPSASQLVIVTGKSRRDKMFEAGLRSQLAGLTVPAKPEFLTGLPTEAVLKRLAELTADTVVFTPGYFEDGDGRVFAPRDAVQAMSAAAAAPVYAPVGTYMGTGVVGGYMIDYLALGKQAGQVIDALLRGAAPASIPVSASAPTSLTLDWRQVRRWGLDEKAIPGDAIIHFREPTLLQGHRTEVIIAIAVFLLQAALIAVLLFERRRRLLAEQAVQMQRSELAHASRLAVAGELTGAIAHEIYQPLCAILSNADTAEMILQSGAERRDELGALLADIRRDDLRASKVITRLRDLLANHEAEQQPFELDEVVSDVEEVLRGEAKRRGVALEFRPATAAEVVGDRIQIQQVVINLVLNAMDAVADLNEDRRAVVVSLECKSSCAVIAVRDRGHGIAAENLLKIFDSFFSTKKKGMGLGLSIVRTIVEAHGGRVWAENDPSGGAVFYVELPLAGVQNALPEPV
jgi:signal transduction histidine kinase